MTNPQEFDLADLNASAAQLTPSDPTAIGSTYGLTGWDNGRRLALYEALNLRYVNDRDTWYRWCDERWCLATKADLIAASARTALRIAEETIHVDDDDQRTRHAAWANTSLQPQALREFANMGAAVDELRIEWNDFDALGDWLNFPNCTLNPMTLDWHKHNRKDLLTQVCPTPYVPDATSERFQAFLEQFLPDDKEREYTLQMLAVAALSCGNDARRLIVILGPTATGKSTLMDLLKRTLGNDYVASVNPSVFRGNLDDKPRPDLLRALKTRVVLAFEASEHWELHTDQIKRMTGGDPITARAMRSDVMNETVATFVPFIIANTVPRIRGADDALRRRMVALLMDAAATENDDDGRLRRELVNDEDARRAFLALLVKTYHNCGGRVTLPIPLRFAEKTMEMFAALDDVDDVLSVLKEEGSIYPITEDTGIRCITTSMLYKCYTTWIKRHGTHQSVREMIGSKQFAQRLQSLGYELRRSNGTRVMGWAMGSTTTTNIAEF